jgi:ribosomal protein S18 acetylase RimI-like enzyme
MCSDPVVQAPGGQRHEISYRRLDPDEVARVGEIDRTEQVSAIYVQHGERLERRPAEHTVPGWLPDGESAHSVAHQREFLEAHVAAGAVVLGALQGERLIGLGVVTPHIRPRIAQLTFLYVSDGFRRNGVGLRLTEELERIAQAAGATEMVVSATPTENTVRFYLHRGYEPTADPLPELVELEPEDIHLRKRL